MNTESIKIEVYENNFNNIAFTEAMKSHEFSDVMIESCIDDISQCEMRYYIGDDSGSMNTSDGEIYNEKTGKMMNDSRLNEMKASIGKTFEIMTTANIKSMFLTLNNGDIMVDPLDNKGGNAYSTAYKRTFVGTNRATPLNATFERVAAHAYNIPGKKILVVYSDGESSDGDITQNIISLGKLDIHIIIRLCTDNETVVKYWNAFDKHPEISLDIIDSYKDEMKPIKVFNPKLNYTYKLHCIREIGLFSPIYDRLDEQTLSEGEIGRINAIFSPSTPEGCGCTIM